MFIPSPAIDSTNSGRPIPVPRDLQPPKARGAAASAAAFQSRAQAAAALATAAMEVEVQLDATDQVRRARRSLIRVYCSRDFTGLWVRITNLRQLDAKGAPLCAAEQGAVCISVSVRLCVCVCRVQKPRLSRDPFFKLIATLTGTTRPFKAVRAIERRALVTLKAVRARTHKPNKQARAHAHSRTHQACTALNFA